MADEQRAGQKDQQTPGRGETLPRAGLEGGEGWPDGVGGEGVARYPSKPWPRGRHLYGLCGGGLQGCEGVEAAGGCAAVQVEGCRADSLVCVCCRDASS